MTLYAQILFIRRVNRSDIESRVYLSIRVSRQQNITQLKSMLSSPLCRPGGERGGAPLHAQRKMVLCWELVQWDTTECRVQKVPHPADIASTISRAQLFIRARVQPSYDPDPISGH